MLEEIRDAAPQEIADAVLNKVKHFTVGFGRAGEKPAAKGSGVLVKHSDLTGILTCAHVDKLLRKLKQPVGLVRLNRGLAEQFGTLDMEEVDSYVAGEEPWTAGREDLALFTCHRTSSETSQRTAWPSTLRGTPRSPSPTVTRR
jgi:hypothetical protein